MGVAQTLEVQPLALARVDMCPELEASILASQLSTGATLERIVRRLHRAEHTGRVRVALGLVASIRAVPFKASAPEPELRTPIVDYRSVDAGEKRTQLPVQN